MQLSVYLLGREVATLEPSGDFKSMLSYHPGVAKNYLHEPEIQSLNRIVTMWLDYAEDQALRRKEVFLKD